MKIKDLTNRQLLVGFGLVAAIVVVLGWALIPIWQIFIKGRGLGHVTLPLMMLTLATLFVVPLRWVIFKATRFSISHLKRPWLRFTRFLLAVAVLIVSNVFFNTFGYLMVSWGVPASYYGSPLSPARVLFEDAQGMLGLLLVVGVAASYFIGIYLWHSELRSPKLQRFVYYPSMIVVGWILFFLFSKGQLLESVNQTFYRWFVTWRDERSPASLDVSVLQLWQGWPEGERLAKLLSLAEAGTILIPRPPQAIMYMDSAQIAKLTKPMPTERIIWPSNGALEKWNLKTADVIPFSTDVFQMVYASEKDFSNDMVLAAVKERNSRMNRRSDTIKVSATKRGRILLNHYVLPQSYVRHIPFNLVQYDNRDGSIFASSGMYKIDFKGSKIWKPRFVYRRSATGGSYSEWEENVDVRKAPKAVLPELKDKILIVSVPGQPFFLSTEYAMATVIQNIMDADYLDETSSEENTILATLFIAVLAGIYGVAGRWRALGLSVAFAGFLVMILYVLFVKYSSLVDASFVVFGFGISVAFFFPYEIAAERRHLLEERTRLSAELRTAHDMQMGLMPTEDPNVKGFEISGICIPASEVGGDFYDYVWLDKKHTRLGIALADVSGKAMKAAMTAVMTSGMLYSEAQRNQSPREILARINQPLYLRSDKRVFTALSFAVIDTITRILTYSSAGQSHPVLIRNGVPTYIKTDGVRLPLGVKEELKYRDISLKLRTGDTVVFYTDGVPESMNPEHRLYGFERFEELLKQNHELTAKELWGKIVEDVQLFTKGVEQHDDMTVVVVKVLS